MTKTRCAEFINADTNYPGLQQMIIIKAAILIQLFYNHKVNEGCK